READDVGAPLPTTELPRRGRARARKVERRHDVPVRESAVGGRRRRSGPDVRNTGVGGGPGGGERDDLAVLLECEAVPAESVVRGLLRGARVDRRIAGDAANLGRRPLVVLEMEITAAGDAADRRDEGGRGEVVDPDHDLVGRGDRARERSGGKRSVADLEED